MDKTIKNFLESDDVTKLADSTQELYGYALQHLRKFCSYHNIMKTRGFQDYMPMLAKYLRYKEVSGKSIQRYVTVVKIFFKWAKEPVQYTYRISNTETKANKRKALQRWLTGPEIDKCLAYQFENVPAYPGGKYGPTKRLRNRIVVRLLVETGARVREVSFIEAKDVDFKNKIIWLRESKTEPRPAFVSHETLELLREYEKALGWDWDGNIFPSVNATKALITDMLKDLKLKKPKDGRGAHTFRHWVATNLYHRGMKMSDIAILLGDKEETIRDHYIHLTPQMLREKVVRVMGWEK